MSIAEQNERALTQAKLDLIKMQIERDVLKAQVERLQIVIDELKAEILTNKK